MIEEAKPTHILIPDNLVEEYKKLFPQDDTFHCGWGEISEAEDPFV